MADTKTTTAPEITAQEKAAAKRFLTEAFQRTKAGDRRNIDNMWFLIDADLAGIWRGTGYSSMPELLESEQLCGVTSHMFRRFRSLLQRGVLGRREMTFIGVDACCQLADVERLADIKKGAVALAKWVSNHGNRHPFQQTVTTVIQVVLGLETQTAHVNWRNRALKAEAEVVKLKARVKELVAQTHEADIIHASKATPKRANKKGSAHVAD